MKKELYTYIYIYKQGIRRIQKSRDRRIQKEERRIQKEKRRIEKEERIMQKEGKDNAERAQELRKQ